MNMSMKKLANIIAKLEVGKTHRNDFGRYNYRTAEDILQGLKPLLIEYGMFVAISDEIVAVGDRFYVKATVKCFDTEDGSLIAETSAYAREASQKKGQDEAQITGSASSYARKYALGGMFNLAVAADGDEIAAEKAKKAAEETAMKERGRYEPRHTAAQLAEALAQAGIDANDFAGLIYGKRFAELRPKDIDYCLDNYVLAVEEYHKRDAARPMGT